MLPELVEFLFEAGRRAPSADNTQPWTFRWNGDALSVVFAERESPSVLGPESPATLMSMGAVAENIVQAAAAAGTALSCNVMPAPRVFFRARPESKISVPTEARQHALFSRHTNRLPYRSGPVPETVYAELRSMREGPAVIRVEDRQSTIRQLGDLVRTASQVRFQIRDIHEWFSSSLRFSVADVARGDGLDVRTLPLPPGGIRLLQALSDWRRMQRLNHFGMYRLLASIEALPVRRAPLVVGVISTPEPGGFFAAGRLMERVWIELNAKGLSVQPYYVITELLWRLRNDRIPPHLVGRLERLEPRLASLLELGDGTLCMLLRAGFPRREPVRSVRLPPDIVFRDDSA